MCDSYEPLGRRSSIGAHFSNELQKKGLLVTYLIVLARMPVLFMRSLVQTAGQKMAAHTVVFSRHSNVDFLANRTKYRVKKC